MPDKFHILLIGGELHVQDLLGEFLDQLGYDSFPTANLAEALALDDPAEFSTALIDLSPLDQNQLEGIALLRKERPVIKVIIMTGNPTLDLVIGAMRCGVSDVVIKPFRFEDLRNVLARTDAQYRLDKETVSLRELIIMQEERICQLEQASGNIGLGANPIADGSHAERSGAKAKEVSDLTNANGTVAEADSHLCVATAHNGHVTLTSCCVNQRGF